MKRLKVSLNVIAEISVKSDFDYLENEGAFKDGNYDLVSVDVEDTEVLENLQEDDMSKAHSEREKI